MRASSYKLWQYWKRRKCKKYYTNIEDSDGIFVNINNINAIVLNYKKIDTSTKEKCVLAEELGHYYQNAVYSPFCSDVSFISKQEFKAKKWAFKQLISPTEIKKLISKGINTKYEIAEELGVTEDLLCLAYQYYIENNYI